LDPDLISKDIEHLGVAPAAAALRAWLQGLVPEYTVR